MGATLFVLNTVHYCNWDGPEPDEIEDGDEVEYDVHDDETASQFVGVYSSPRAAAEAASKFVLEFLPSQAEMQGPLSGINVSTSELDGPLDGGSDLVDIGCRDDVDEIYEVIQGALKLREERAEEIAKRAKKS